MGATVSMLVLVITKIGRYYRTTVPREVRKILGLKENDKVEWILEDGKDNRKKEEWRSRLKVALQIWKIDKKCGTVR